METIEYELPPHRTGRLLVVNVGSDDRPATSEDIQDITEQIAKAKDIMDEHGSATIVTHHLVTFTILDL